MADALHPRWDETLGSDDLPGDGSITIGLGVSYARRRAASSGAIVVPARPAGRTIADEYAGRPPPPLPDRFRLLRRIGGDGQVDIHLAEQTALAREVELRILRDPSDRAGIAAQARLLARLNHPGVIPVHDAGDDLLILGSARGESLAALAIRQPGGANLGALVEALARACDTVAYAHSQGVLHRDLTPGAIVVGSYGEVWVRDWDRAVELVDGRARLAGPAEAAVGTPAWMAPECARGEMAAITAAADVFQLGAILFRLLAGRPPWAADSAWDALRLAMRGGVTPAAVAAPGCPAALAAACDRACDHDPTRRGRAGDLAAALRAWLQAHASASEADRIATEADQLARAATTDDGWMAAVAAAERAIGLAAGDHPVAVAARRRAAAAWGRAALARGDLGLAAAQAAQADDETLAATVAGTSRLHARRSLHRRRATLAGLSAAAALVAIAAALLWWGADRRPDRDPDAAARLLRAAQAVDLPGDAGWSTRCAVLRAADAADPGAGTAALTAAATAWVEASQDGALALALADQIERSGGQAGALRAAAGRLRDDNSRAAVHVAVRWRQAVAAGDRAAAAIATAPAGELTTAITALIDGDQSDRRAAVRLLACRDDLAGGVLVRLLDDEDPLVCADAVHAAAARGETSLLPRVVAALRRLASRDPWQARLAGTACGPSAAANLRAAAFAPTADDLLLIGDIEGRIAAAEAAAAAPGGLDHAATLAAARLALFHLDQGDRALALLAGLDNEPEAVLLRAHAWLRLGQPARARQDLSTMTATTPAAVALGLLAAVHAQDGPAIGPAADAVAAIPAERWGDDAALAARALRAAGRHAAAQRIDSAAAGRWQDWLTIAEDAWRRGDTARARRIDALICERFPWLAAPCRQAAGWCAAEGSAAEAAAWRHRVAARDPFTDGDDG